jgi:Outer membrane protein beta-barrel domain
MTTIRLRALIGVLICTLAPSTAHADFLVEPFFVWTRNKETARWLPGGGAAVEYAAGWLLVGGEVGYASDYFDPSVNVGDLIAASHVLTIAGTAGITMPARRDADRFFPYATVGVGWMRQHARDRGGSIDVQRNDPALNFGGGVRFLFSEFLGVRADVRHFRSLRDPFESPDPLVADLERVNFWRVGVGAVIRFGSQ